MSFDLFSFFSFFLKNITKPYPLFPFIPKLQEARHPPLPTLLPTFIHQPPLVHHWTAPPSVKPNDGGTPQVLTAATLPSPSGDDDKEDTQQQHWRPRRSFPLHSGRSLSQGRHTAATAQQAGTSLSSFSLVIEIYLSFDSFVFAFVLYTMLVCWKYTKWVIKFFLVFWFLYFWII